MKVPVTTLFALAAAVAAVPQEKRSVNPASASLALLQALPSSLQAVALTNSAAAASEISAEFATGTPTWFTVLPTDVQTYFLTAAGSAAPMTTGFSNTTVTGKFHNSTTSSAAATSSAEASSTEAAASASGTASSSSSSGGAAMPTQMISAGLAGALGFIGMLAL